GSRPLCNHRSERRRLRLAVGPDRVRQQRRFHDVRCVEAEQLINVERKARSRAQAPLGNAFLWKLCFFETRITLAVGPAWKQSFLSCVPKRSLGTRYKA